jgi:hypothetical protein
VVKEHAKASTTSSKHLEKQSKLVLLMDGDRCQPIDWGRDTSLLPNHGVLYQWVLLAACHLQHVIS